MNSHQLILPLLLALLGIAAAQDRPDKPNVILILTDDLGWQDVKCYDIDEPSPMETPNIDAFAKKGVMFWQAYSPAPTCAPSRCAIMSGNHPARAQKTHVVGGAPPAPRAKNVRMMDPWYSGRMPADELTLAKVLRRNGYTTGHSGKWHMAIDHNAFPQPGDQGFDYTRSDRGSRNRMKDRLANFATGEADDPYRLDENGYPFHQNNEDALTFLREQKDKPFFLYYATWLVHSPIHTRSKERLAKYAKKLGVDSSKPVSQATPGQINPFYCAMVEELDYYLGTVFDYLDNTDDPRWPGHKLSENTFVIFTSDNGGMEGDPTERYTDNFPLDRGKISAMEGGTRVPLIIAGPGIASGVQTDVMANGLDFYPTVLSMAGIERPKGKHFDGCDLMPLLLGDPKDAQLVKDSQGTVRDSMVWHFPHGVALESTIRVGDYKLIRNYNHLSDPQANPLELYRLYETDGNTQKRVDIEESKDLVSAMPDKVQELDAKLTAILSEMEASYPYYNPDCGGDLPNKAQACTVLKHEQSGRKVEFVYGENGAKVTRADLIYTRNGGHRYEEWFRVPGKLIADSRAVVQLPEGATHYFLNLIDENQFLRSYPKVAGNKKRGFAKSAIAVVETVRETFPPLLDGKAPKNYEALWAQFDPRLEPLDIEILKEWEEDGVVLQVLRYRVGVFKGEKAMVAAVFGYPKGGKKKLPGLVQIHGGGQYADYQAVLTNAKRGYVTISIAWAGRISAPDYRVSPAEVKLFWDGATTDPHYRVTTDWGALDGYHAPSKNPKNVFPKLPEPAPWTLDAVKSPRNNGWFLCTLAARRALTLLELHPRVAPDKLGVYGHSMGGKLTVMTAGSDGRVKAAAPSCGGVSDRYNKDPLFRATIGDDVYLRHLSCPVMFLSPANDFHGRINDLQTAVTEIAAKEWRATSSPHHNHQDSAQYEVATQLWFDQHLKGAAKLPETPSASIALSTKSQIPSYSIQPDSSRRILAVDVFYTQQGRSDGERVNAIHQFWHHAPTNEDLGFWTAPLPLWSNEKPLWVYANVTYALDTPISGAGYYYGSYTADRFTISSKMTIVAAELLQGNGVKATLKPSLVIEDFEGDWQKEWFTYKPEHWARKTHKVYHPQWAAPKGAKLAIGVRSADTNKLVIGIDQYAAEIGIEGGSEWREITLSPSDFRDAAGATLTGWEGIKELRLGDQETLRDRKLNKKLSLGASWKGERPAFRALRWAR